MAFPGASRLRTPREEQGEPLLVPLAIPLIAGPSSLATVLLLSSRQPEQDWVWAGAIALSVALVWVVLALAQPLSRRLGRPVLTAMERLMGLLLSAMAIEMLINGLRQAFPSSLN
jgi:multiple antibiotic resistance protein